jgi:hypothetical protein
MISMRTIDRAPNRPVNFMSAGLSAMTSANRK